MKRILITGAAGFIGLNAVKYFSRHGYRVTSMDLNHPKESIDGAVFHQCDLLNLNRLISIFRQSNPELVLHLGARTDTYERKSIQGYSANIAGVHNLLEAANACSNLGRIIVTSSRLVCRVGHIPSSDQDFCPPNLYGESKVETERIVRNTEIRAQWIITRPTAIWGPGFQIPSYRDFFEQIRRGSYLHLGRTNPRKTFGYIENFLFQMEKLLLAPREQVDRKLFYVGDYEPLMLRNWADMIAHEFGRRPPRTLPLWLFRALAGIGDGLRFAGWSSVPLTSYRLGNMLRDSVHDCSTLEKITGPLPVDLAEATRRTVGWLRSNN